jgi:tripartite-type tricarboxylate transporter receptor subunit TctC
VDAVDASPTGNRTAQCYDEKREETMHRLFRLSAIGTLLCGALFASGVAQAQDTAAYPARPVKIIVPFAPAGPTDVMARLVAQKLSDSLGKQFYVENHPGAGGNLGMALVAGAPPDGYTLLMVSSSVVVNPSLYEKVPYDVYKSLAPVTLAGSSPNILVVHPSVPAKSVKELIAYVQANPGKVSFASPGFGTTASLAAENFKYALKLDIQPVPFNGAGPALNAVVAGQVQIGFMALPPVTPHLQAGTLRALAMTTEKRVAAAPDVPTMAEAGVPGDQISDVMQAMFAPASTPKSIIDLLQKEVAKAVTTADVKAKLDSLGFEAIADTPEHFAARIKAEVPKWAKVIEAAKIEKVK